MSELHVLEPLLHPSSNPTPMCFFSQGPEHPNPGKPFTARGFPRQCYLPDNAQGRKVTGGPVRKDEGREGQLAKMGEDRASRAG